MTFIPDNSLNLKNVAQPRALTILEHSQSTSQTIVLNNKVQLSTSHNWFGNFTPVVSSDIIILPQGYCYYIESSIQAYDTGSYNYNEYTSIQHYDETNSLLVGTVGTVVTAGQGEDQYTWSRDSVARIILDCSSNSLNISLKIIDNSGHTHINYNSDQVTYAGLGRTVIWQLDI